MDKLKINITDACARHATLRKAIEDMEAEKGRIVQETRQAELKQWEALYLKYGDNVLGMKPGGEE